MQAMIQKIWQLSAGILCTVLQKAARLFGKELTEQTLEKIMQFVKFGMVGVLNTAVSFITYYAVILIRRDWYMFGGVAGFILSVLNSYYWNSKFVFKKQDEKIRTLIRTFVAYSSNLMLGTVLLWLLVERLGISPFLAPFFNLLITVPLNFLLNKFWVMKKHKLE